MSRGAWQVRIVPVKGLHDWNLTKVWPKSGNESKTMGKYRTLYRIHMSVNYKRMKQSTAPTVCSEISSFITATSCREDTTQDIFQIDDNRSSRLWEGQTINCSGKQERNLVTDSNNTEARREPVRRKPQKLTTHLLATVELDRQLATAYIVQRIWEYFHKLENRSFYTTFTGMVVFSLFRYIYSIFSITYPSGCSTPT